MSNNTDDGERNSTDDQTYQLDRVTVRPASPNTPGTFEYSDLKRGNLSLVGLTVHALYWPLYLSLLFPLQWTARCFLMSFRLWYLSPVGRLHVLISDGIANGKKLRFLNDPNRRVLYLRASRLFTPAQLFPFLPGSAPNPSSDSGQDRPWPENWNAIRRAVYERDDYRCVNCGAGGGPHGNAELHADHVIPRSQGGSDDPENLRTLCHSCHAARHAQERIGS